MDRGAAAAALTATPPRTYEGRALGTVLKRYSELSKLQTQLKQLHPREKIKTLPRKTFGSADEHEVERRVLVLGAFVQQLLLNPVLQVGDALAPL